MDEHFMTVLRTEKTFGQKYAEVLSTKQERIRTAQNDARDESLLLLKQAQQQIEQESVENNESIKAELQQIDAGLNEELRKIDSLDIDALAAKIMKKVVE